MGHGRIGRKKIIFCLILMEVFLWIGQVFRKCAVVRTKYTAIPRLTSDPANEFFG